MSVKILVDSFESNEWDAEIRRFADYSVYQNEAYQAVRAEADHQSVTKMAAVNDRGETVMMCHIRVKSLRPFPFRIGYVQAGPLVLRNGGVHPDLEDAFRALREACHARRIHVLRIVPNVPRSENGEKIEQVGISAGFTKASTVVPYYTILVSLKESEEEIRARMDKGGRRALRKVESLPIEVQARTDDHAFDELERLYAEARSRKGFQGLDSAEFAAMQRGLEAKDKAVILMACHDGECVTAHATTHFGKTAVPILAASNEAGLRLGTSYLLWWKAYCMAKERGMEYYDTGGIDPQANPSVYFFKQRLGGEEIKYIGAFDSCSSEMVRTAWGLMEKSYRFLKDRRNPSPEKAATGCEPAVAHGCERNEHSGGRS